MKKGKFTKKSPLKHTEGHSNLSKAHHIQIHGGDAVAAGYEGGGEDEANQMMDFWQEETKPLLEFLPKSQVGGTEETQPVGTKTKTRPKVNVKTDEETEEELEYQKNKAEELDKIRQEEVNADFWDGYTYKNPSKGGSGYKSDVAEGASIPISRKDYKKVDQEWVWVNPDDPTDIDDTLAEKTINELNEEDVRVGERLIGGEYTYDSLEEKDYTKKKKEFIDNYVTAEDETADDKSSFSKAFGNMKKKVEAINSFNESELYNPEFEEKIKDKKEKKKKEDPNYIISNKEEAEILGLEESEVEDKYGEDTRSSKHEESIKDVGKIQEYSDEKMVFYQGEGEDDTYQITKIDGIERSELLLKNSQTYRGDDAVTWTRDGKEASKEDIAEFHKKVYIKEWDDKIQEEIGKNLSPENKMLLRKNPELYLSNTGYQAKSGANVEAEGEGGDVAVTREVGTKYYTDDHVVMTKEFPFFKSVKRNEMYDHVTVTDHFETPDGRVYQTLDDGTKVFNDWLPGTPQSVKDNYAEAKKIYDEAYKKEEGNKKFSDEFRKTRDEFNDKWKPIYNNYHRESPDLTNLDYYSIAEKDFQNALNLKVKEVQAEAQAYFEEKSNPIREKIAEELNNEFQQRFQKNIDGEITEISTGKVVSENFINTLYKKEFQKKYGSDPEIIKLNLQNKALFANTLEKYQEAYKPSFELIGEHVYNEIANRRFRRLLTSKKT